MIKKIKIMNNQKGMAAMLMLVMFVLICLIFYAMYKFVLNDYVTINKSIEDQRDQLRQQNLVETLKHNYMDDMRNDIEFDSMAGNQELSNHSMVFKKNFDKYKNSEDDEELKIVDVALNSGYINYQFVYDKSEIDDSCLTLNNKIDINGEFGRCGWVKYLNYDEFLPDENDDYPKYKRVYSNKDNWNKLSTGKNKDLCEGVCEKTSENWILMLPKTIYLKIEFDSSVNGVEIEIGGESDYVDNYYINRGLDYEIVKFDGLPGDLSSSDITLYSDNDLGSTSFSILNSREVDVEVTEQNNFGEASDKVLLNKTIRIMLDKYSNKVDFNAMEER